MGSFAETPGLFERLGETVNSLGTHSVTKPQASPCCCDPHPRHCLGAGAPFHVLEAVGPFVSAFMVSVIQGKAEGEQYCRLSGAQRASGKGGHGSCLGDTSWGGKCTDAQWHRSVHTQSGRGGEEGFVQEELQDFTDEVGMDRQTPSYSSFQAPGLVLCTPPTST